MRTRVLLLVMLASLGAAGALRAQGGPPGGGGGGGGITLTVSGDPAPLQVSTAMAGAAPPPATDNSTVYDLTINPNGTYKITAQLDLAMPAGLTLEMQLAAPAGASSLGRRALSPIAQDMVTAIPKGSYAGLGISYWFTAALSAGTVPMQSRIVTLTVTTAP